MFLIERLDSQGWISEFECKTEFKAFINARTQCMATGRAYRIINQDNEIECVITLDDCKQQFQAR